MEGNEMADSYAMRAAEGYTDPVGKEYLRDTGLAHLSKMTTQARS